MTLSRKIIVFKPTLQTTNKLFISVRETRLKPRNHGMQSTSLTWHYEYVYLCHVFWEMKKANGSCHLQSLNIPRSRNPEMQDAIWRRRFTICKKRKTNFYCSGYSTFHNGRAFSRPRREDSKGFNVFLQERAQADAGLLGYSIQSGQVNSFLWFSNIRPSPRVEDSQLQYEDQNNLNILENICNLSHTYEGTPSHSHHCSQIPRNRQVM